MYIKAKVSIYFTAAEVITEEKPSKETHTENKGEASTGFHDTSVFILNVREMNMPQRPAGSH